MSADDSGPLGSWLATLVVPVFFSSGVIVRIISGIFIASHAHGGDLATSTGALDDQRVAAVPLRVQAEDVVAALERCEGVRLVECLQTDLECLGRDVHAAHIPHNLALLLCRSLDLLHLVVVLRQLLEVLVAARCRLQLGRDQALDRERRGRLDGDAGQAGQNGQLAGNIHAVEVVARVGLGVAELLGRGDLGRPLAGRDAGGRVGGRKRVEEEGQGAAEDTLDLGDLIASVDEVVDGRDEGQAGTARGLVVDLGARSGGRVEDVLPQLEGAGKGLLVGGHDADAAAQELGVGIRDVLGRGVVDKDDLGGGDGEVVDEGGQGERLGLGGGKGRSGAGNVDLGIVGRVDGLLAGGDVAEAKADGRATGGQGSKLAQEALAHATGAWLRSVRRSRQ
ncbi:hypothetical protein F503_06266 [Ophiostoma piceae UAMH 11346]|uniref:Uncharacterized protein n=1 Tax=Ophiostoma piceae (strain UAMH 11346) TaxID=1262450 RepID=S3BW19_OPHP1|nr:hypothetical protein F503_06266 [Ophiostoma piceae UAMH 11346]